MATARFQRVVLSDLIKTLKEYPQMKVKIDGQFGISRGDKFTTLKTKVPVKGFFFNKPIKYLTEGRAQAIIDLLIENGVNANQLIKGGGQLGSGAKVKFQSTE